jgi:3-oxoacyl-[acyl-carrier protein] reductase
MNKQIQKVALVTGASRGIGAAIAQRLASDGFTVIVNYAENAAPAEALVRSIEQAGGHALAAKADVSDAADVRRLFDAAETAFGGVDVLVNNAGIMSLATIADADDASFDRQIAVNLKGTFNTLREAAKRLRAGGRIINFSSSVVALLQPTYAVYAATKAGVEAMSECVCQGTAWTRHHGQHRCTGPDCNGSVPQRQAAGSGRSSGQARASRTARTAQDIANTVAFLAGPDGGWINGQVLRANGGII